MVDKTRHMSKELGKTGMSVQHMGCTVLLGQKQGPHTCGCLINSELRTLRSYYSDQEGIKTSGNTWLSSVKTGAYSANGTGTPSERK